MSDRHVVEGALLGVDEVITQLRHAATAAEDIVTTTASALTVLDQARTASDTALRDGSGSRAFENGYDAFKDLRRRAARMSEDAAEILNRTQRASDAVSFAAGQVAALTHPHEAERLHSRLTSAQEVLEVARSIASQIRDNADAVADMFVHTEEPKRLSRAINTAGDHVNRVQGSTVAMRAILASSHRGVSAVSHAGTELKQAVLQRTAPPPRTSWSPHR